MHCPGARISWYFRSMNGIKSCAALLLFLFLFACKAQNHEEMKNPNNHLSGSDSPYLLQHKDNPVNWYPWGDEALAKAKAENKLLVISIGYAACHWCHVMEHESFEDSVVAAVMNRNFVSIKVDREQRPDIDNIYMTAAQMITGRGGWPLNVIALPDGRPVYAGTYFPKEQWIKFLKYFSKMWKEEPEKLIEQAEKVTAGIQQSEQLPMVTVKGEFGKEDLDNIWEKFEKHIDPVRGGRRGAPKFPMPDNWEYLMEYAALEDNTPAARAVETTLDAMARGGIYDHVGGGFARYSTDDQWHIPHFEKMLYDNAQLVSLYSHAWQWKKKARYREVVYETLAFVNRELRSPEGGFFSSLDADSEGEEGKFYVWTAGEIRELLADDAPLFMDYYDVQDRGNWEDGKNVLRVDENLEDVASRYKISVEKAKEIIERSKKKLLEARSQRVRPGLDDKVLTAWNALMLEGFTDAYLAFAEPEFLEAALVNARFLEKNMMGEDYRLLRNYKDGNASIPAFLDDYALLINAYIKLYEATFDEHWLENAQGLAGYAREHFFDSKSGLFFYTSDKDPSLIARKTEVSDNVIPSSNSAMAMALFRLGQYYYNDDYLAMAEQMLHNVKEQILQQPPYFSNWARLLLLQVHPPYEVAITGPGAHDMMLKLAAHYLPDVLFSGAEKESSLELLKDKFRTELTIYVCQNKACRKPVHTAEDALKQLRP